MRSKIGLFCLVFASLAVAQDPPPKEEPKKPEEPPRRLFLPAPYERFDTPRFSDPPRVEQPGATYEDDIERLRKQLQNPPPPPPPAPVRPSDPFKLWEPPPPRTGVQFHADASITQQNIFYWRDGQEYRYGTLDDLKEHFLGLPPPPPPPPYTRIGQIWQNNPPLNTDPYYTPLLQFLQAGPGPNGLGSVGNLLTVAQLQQITPALLALAPQLRQLQNGGITINQLALTPQTASFLSVAQSILQPLGMWNTATLIAWYFYLGPSQQNQLISILNTLETNILIALNIPPGQYNNIDIIVQPPPLSPYAVINEMNDLWEKGDSKEIAARYPDLAYSLIKHAGFTRPQGVLYGNRQGRENSLWPYNIGIITEQRNNNHREIWVLNQSGFFVNKTASGVGRYYQGPDDLTLSYVPFEVDRAKKITTLDVRASEDYTLLKRAVGGDVQILNRASTDTTGILYADMPFFGEHLHLRPFVGTTTYATTCGAMVRLDYGTDELFNGHVGGGTGYRQTMFSSDHDDLINYLETENIIRTPYLSIGSPDGERGIRLWPSLTLAASSMLTRSIEKYDTKQVFDSSLDNSSVSTTRWTLQAETRLIPELHGQLATPYALFTVWGGVTTAIVPGGNLNLEHPEKTLGLHPIRSHVGLTCRIKFSDIIEPSPYYLEIGWVGEFSKLVNNTRAGIRFGGGIFYVDCLAELEKYSDTSFTDVRIGGGVGCYGISLQGLQSIQDGDYRIQASIDVMALIDLEEILPSRGLLDSYGR